MILDDMGKTCDLWDWAQILMHGQCQFARSGFFHCRREVTEPSRIVERGNMQKVAAASYGGPVPLGHRKSDAGMEGSWML